MYTMDVVKKTLPFYAIGKVVRGFGRGSKQLGFPTANFSQELVDRIPSDIETGIYYGLASIENGPIYNMVMSIGWNPFYENNKKSMETHILNNFEEDFYDSIMKVLVLGYVRPEKNFSCVDELIIAIQNDIKYAKDVLCGPLCSKYANSLLLKDTVNMDTPINFVKVIAEEMPNVK